MHTGLVAFIGTPGPMEMLVLGVIAVLLFGKRLPEVGRQLGRGLVEFRKGVQGFQDDVHEPPRTAAGTAVAQSEVAQPEEDREETIAPKFEPPTSEPTEATDDFRD